MMDMIFSVNALWWILLAIYVPSCLGLVVIVLLQKGKGVGFAGAFGAGGGSDAVFGPRSSKSLPQRITYSMAGLFMLLSLLMSMLSGNLGNNAAPELVDETGMSAVDSGAPAGSLGALFNEGGEAPAAAPAETTEEAPAATEEAPAEAAPTAAAEVSVETPMPESTPAAEAPVETAPAATPEAPAAEAPAAAPEAPAAEAPAETPAAQ